MLTQNQKEFLTKLLLPINGIVVSEWTDNCSYLTMNEVQITIKVRLMLELHFLSHLQSIFII